MVTLGLLIGLAFLPALLSICGPLVTVSTEELGKSPGHSALANHNLNRVDSPTTDTTGGDSPTSRDDVYDPADSKAIVAPSIPKLPSTTWCAEKEPDAPEIKADETPSWIEGGLYRAPSQVPPMPDEEEEEEEEQQHSDSHSHSA